MIGNDQHGECEAYEVAGLPIVGGAVDEVEHVPSLSDRRAMARDRARKERVLEDGGQQPPPRPILRPVDRRNRRAYERRVTAVLFISLLFHGVLLVAIQLGGFNIPDPEKLAKQPKELRVRANFGKPDEPPERKPPEPEEREPDDPEEKKKEKKKRKSVPEVEVEDTADEAPEGGELGEVGDPGPSFGGKPIPGAGGSGGTGGGGISVGQGPGRRSPQGATKAKAKGQGEGPTTGSTKGKKKRPPKIDPDTPRPIPRQATPPKPDPGNAQPLYPPPLQKRGIGGRVDMKLHVDRHGRLRVAKITRVELYNAKPEDEERAKKALKQACAQAIKSWHYKPAVLNGETIAVWVKVKFRFGLK